MALTLTTLRRKFGKSLALRGPFGTAKVTLRYLAEQATRLSPSMRRFRRLSEEFDRQHDIDTSGTVPLSELEINAPNWPFGGAYQAIPPSMFDELMRALPVRHEEFALIDIGAGKGRALLLASQYPFRMIIGVEFAPELHATCMENLRRYRSAQQRCRDIEVHCVDALEYQLPAIPSVLFMYNPFGPEIMRPLVNRIGESLVANPRPVYVAYSNPRQADVLDAASFLEPAGEGHGYRIWRSRGTA